MAVVCSKRRLLDVCLVHQYLVVAAAQVELGEELSAAEFIKELVHDWNWEHVTYHLDFNGR